MRCEELGYGFLYRDTHKISEFKRVRKVIRHSLRSPYCYVLDDDILYDIIRLEGTEPYKLVPIDDEVKDILKVEGIATRQQGGRVIVITKNDGTRLMLSPSIITPYKTPTSYQLTAVLSRPIPLKNIICNSTFSIALYNNGEVILTSPDDNKEIKLFTGIVQLHYMAQMAKSNPSLAFQTLSAEGDVYEHISMSGIIVTSQLKKKNVVHMEFRNESLSGAVVDYHFFDQIDPIRRRRYLPGILKPILLKISGEAVVEEPRIRDPRLNYEGVIDIVGQFVVARSCGWTEKPNMD